MSVDISYPYVKVLSIYFRGDVDEGKSGYKIPEEDVYLKTIQEKFHKLLVDNVWSGKHIHGWDILQSEISGPSSSGYENTLTITIGFLDRVHPDFDKDKTRWEKIEELVKEFNTCS